MFNLFQSRPAAAPISLKDAIARVEQGEMALIDVRDISEVKMTGKAKGALHIPLMLLQVKADPRSPECDPALDPQKPVGIYCASGARSHMAAGMLRQMGYGEVHNLGGLVEWANAGGAVEPV